MKNERRILYGLVDAMELFLPQTADRSLTKEKLIGLLSGATISLPRDQLLDFDYNPRIASQRIRKAIIDVYDSQPPIWFETGALPNRRYLSQFLYSLDPGHPLLGARLSIKVPRQFKSQETCKVCERRLIKKEQVKKQKPKPRGTRIQPKPLNVPAKATPYNQVVYALRSRHKILGLDPKFKQAELVRGGFTNPELLAKLQSEVYIIDNIIDRINYLST